MSTDRVVCCFKNLEVYPYGSKILARNLNKLLKTTKFADLEQLRFSDDKYKFECTSVDALCIQENLADLLTTEHRAIWFTYPTVPPKKPSGLLQMILTGWTEESWTVIFNLGAMSSYDTFTGHIPNNQYPASIKIEKDTRGRAKSIILEKKLNSHKLRFALDSLHRDILFQCGQQNDIDSFQVIFMLKGLPQIEEQLRDETVSRYDIVTNAW